MNISPVITLPTVPGGLQLDFKHSVDTRGGTVDYTFIQILTADGVFLANLNSYPYQFTQSPGAWTQADPLDLTAFMGKSLRLRFGFSTVYSASGGHEGRYVDDIRIVQNQPRDYYAVSAKAGERIGASIAPFGGALVPTAYYLATRTSKASGSSRASRSTARCW